MQDFSTYKINEAIMNINELIVNINELINVPPILIVTL